jgi:hypothetical protein
MFDNENQDEELKAFEAKLGSLRPSGEGLDRRWRFLLAEEAAFNRHLPEADVAAAGQLICSRCGGSIAKGGRDKRRWAWPAAFSGMTVVAASLLLALVVRPGPQNVMTADRQNVSPSLASAVDKRADSIPWSAKGIFSRRQLVSGSVESSYLDLRDQVIRDGVESWKSPVSAIAITTNAKEKPQNCREQLDRLLQQERWNGS